MIVEVVKPFQKAFLAKDESNTPALWESYESDFSEFPLWAIANRRSYRLSFAFICQSTVQTNDLNACLVLKKRF